MTRTMIGCAAAVLLAITVGCATTRTATIEPEFEPVRVERPISGPDHDLLNSGR